MRYTKTGAIAGLILAGSLVLAGCGDKDAPATQPSTTPTGMMDDDDMMSPSPTPSAMMSEDDDMMSDG